MTHLDTLALGAVVAAWLIGVGFGAGCWWARREGAWERVELLQQVADLAGEAVEAEAALVEYREAIPKVFDRGFEAGQHLAEHQVAAAEVEQAQRSNARWN
jgi:hypothetical protein